MEKQKIKVVLARTMWDGGETAWKEHKIVEIEIENNCKELYHVVGELNES